MPQPQTLSTSNPTVIYVGGNMENHPPYVKSIQLEYMAPEIKG